MVRDTTINTFLFFINGVICMVNLTRLFSKLKHIGYVKSFIPLNTARIMDTLLKVHGHQLLVNGYFNGKFIFNVFIPVIFLMQLTRIQATFYYFQMEE